MGATGPSTVSSPTTTSVPKANGGSAHNIMDTIDPRSLITEDEPTTEWTPEIPFKNVSTTSQHKEVATRNGKFGVNGLNGTKCTLTVTKLQFPILV